MRWTILDRDPRKESEPVARIVHVLPADLARGAQVFARALREVLDGHPDEHRTLSLFVSEASHLRPDVALDVRDGRMRQFGFDPRAALVLHRALRAMAPDVVVAHGGEALKYAVVARPKTSALVYKKTGSSLESLEGPLRRAVYRRLVGAADMTAAVAQEAVTEATDLLRLAPSRVMLAPNGRDPLKFCTYPVRRDRAVPRMVSVGRLTSGKRPDWFLTAVRRLRDQGVKLEGIIVGDGPLAEELAPSAADASVELLGRREDVPEILAEADVLVFTGVAEGEGMPGVLIEAGLAGLPAISTAVSGARTVISHGVTGLVVPVDDIDALVDAMYQLAVDPGLRARMGAAARQRCLDHFTLSASAARWQELFDGLLERR